MSSSIAIPAGLPSSAYGHRQSGKAVDSSSDSSYLSSPSTPNTPGHMSPTTSRSAQKQKAVHQRRPSLLSSAISHQECTVINIGDPDGPPRLIFFVASGQGYIWNYEHFVPSYVDCEYTPLEHRREPVHDIIITDEEIKNMMPQ